MRSALMSTVRRRSSVIVGSAGLATVCVASAVALAVPSTVASAEAPAATVAAGHPVDAKLSLGRTSVDATVAAASSQAGKLTAAPFKQTAPAGAGHTVTFAPYDTTTAKAPTATPAAAAPAPAAPGPAPAAAPAPAAQPAAPAPAPAAQQPTQQAASRSDQRAALATDTSPSGVRALAQSMVPADQWASFSNIVSHESSWNLTAVNPSSGSYGLGQALPASKMASAGSDWKTNPVTQIKWTLGYMNDRYGSPNAAWSFWQSHHWY